MKWRVLNQSETDVVVAVLKRIEDELLRCYWNKNQKQMASPFDNTGNFYYCGAFSVRAYDWDDYNEMNFVYSDPHLPQSGLIAEWYKHLGRGDFIKVPDSWKMEYLSDMLKRCIEAIRKDYGVLYQNRQQSQV